MPIYRAYNDITNTAYNDITNKQSCNSAILTTPFMV